MDSQDEPQLPGPRRIQRPESRNSMHSRFTPQSSNGSQSRLSGRREGERVPSRNADRAQAGGLLEERLRAKKAAMQSEKRMSIDVDRAIQSSPVRNDSTSHQSSERDQRRPSSSGKGAAPTGKKGMGIKDMEEANNNLHKQNFDLKLELFHRRQKQTALEEQLKDAEARIAEQEEMQVVNEQLLAELEKRDQAVEEAVVIICSLEEKIDRLMQERNIVRNFDAQYETDYFNSSQTTEGTIPSSPPQLPKSVSKLKQPRSVARMPSFLSDQGSGAEALRSLYLPSEKDYSALSLPKPYNSEPDEDAQPEVLNSPRLSVLSESSFLSVYGEKTLPLEALDLDAGPGSADRRQHRKSLSVEQWVEERGNATPVPQLQVHTPSKVRLTPARTMQPLSINAVLESPLQRLEKLERSLNRVNSAATASTQHIPPPIRKTKPFDPKASYSSHALPPTPDTISTSTLRLFKTSNSTLGQDAASVTRSFEHRSPKPSPQNYNEEFRRPRSAGETITSRREGHGWDTTTASSTSSTIADNETVESFDPWLATAREEDLQQHTSQNRDMAAELSVQKQQMLAPPDMFSFSAMEPVFTEDALGIYGEEGERRPRDGDGWGRDMMFDHTAGLDLPGMSRHLQRIGVGEEPRSDDTVRARPSHSRHPSASGQGTSGDSSPSPQPPPRRSSLGTSGRLRKDKKGSTPQVQPQAQFPMSSPGQGPQRQTAKNRITSRLFGRSESFPAPGPAPAPPAHGTTGASVSDIGAGANSRTTPSPRKQGTSNPNQRSPLPRSQTYNDFSPSRQGPGRSASSQNSFGDANTLERRQMDGQAGNNRRAMGHVKRLSVDLESLHTNSATPPPISRYARNAGPPQVDRNPGRNAGLNARRPSSAGNHGGGNGSSSSSTTGGIRFAGKFNVPLVGRARRESHGAEDFGADGAGDERERERMERAERQRPVTQGVIGQTSSSSGGAAGNVKKWFGGLGRSGSIKK